MPEVQSLLTDHQLARECLDYVALQGLYYTIVWIYKMQDTFHQIFSNHFELF